MSQRMTMLSKSFWIPTLAVVLMWQLPAQADYTGPRLEAVVPPGGKAGNTIEVELRGDNLDEPTSLIFSDNAIKSSIVPPPPPPTDPKKKKKYKAPPTKYKITIPKSLEPGNYDVRFVGKWGISNPRTFVVGTLNEMIEKEPNSDVKQAQKVELGTVVNGIINGNADVDYFTFSGKKGQRIILHCAGSSIDSRMNPAIEVYNSDDDELVANRQYRNKNALVDCVLPADGEYYARVFQFTYIGGGDEYFYRLTISTNPWVDAVYPPAVQRGKANSVTLLGRNLPGGKAGPMSNMSRQQLQELRVNVSPPSQPQRIFRGTNLPSAASVDAFEYRLKTGANLSNPVLLNITDEPVVLDNLKNESAKTAQSIKVPCCLCGRIEKPRDRDYYVFEAKKGDVFYLEGYGDRIGAPMDLYFRVRQLDEKTPRVLGEYDTHAAIPDIVGNFYTYSGDPHSRFVAPADGKYELLVSSRTADILGGPRYIYSINIRKEKPDFRLVLVGNNEDSTAGCTVRRGASEDLKVWCFRNDGFDGEVLVTIDGLPAGVTCPPQVVGPKSPSMNLVLTAANNAKDWAGEIRIKGEGTINGKKVVREARAGCLVWPAPNNSPAVSRLARSITLAVREPGIYALQAPQKEVEVPSGGQGSVKIRIQRFKGDFKSTVQVTRVSGPVLTNGNLANFPNTNIANNKNEAEIKFTLPTSTVPGTFNLVFLGKGQYRYMDPKTKRPRNIQVYVPSEPIKVVVYNKVAKLSVDKPKLTLQGGKKAEVRVKVERLHKYKGEFQVTMKLPGGLGVSAKKTKVPANANEAKIELVAGKDAKARPDTDVKILLTARVQNRVTMTHEITMKLNVTKAVAGKPKRAGHELAARLAQVLTQGVVWVMGRVDVARLD